MSKNQLRYTKDTIIHIWTSMFAHNSLWPKRGDRPPVDKFWKHIIQDANTEFVWCDLKRRIQIKYTLSNNSISLSSAADTTNPKLSKLEKNINLILESEFPSELRNINADWKLLWFRYMEDYMHFPKIQFIYDQYPHLINEFNTQGHTALYYSAAPNGGSISIAKWYIDQGARLDLLNNKIDDIISFGLNYLSGAADYIELMEYKKYLDSVNKK